ncbi:MAG: YHS domain-containing protein [Desulfohalobiaceae bacterium]|nr:YHS domain-containing protein [Desulfohalobiaceae bacterium]
MIKILVFVVAGFLLYKMIMGDRNKKVADKKKQEPPIEETGEMVKDPVCGTYVSNDSPIRVKEGDQIHYFCSYECRDAFLKQQDS